MRFKQRRIYRERSLRLKDIVIVDYGLGNILSVTRAFEYIGCTVTLATSPAELTKASKIVIPGVGAFPVAASRLESLGLRDALQKVGVSGVPILGICLGMQLLFTTGYEYRKAPGLGLIPGEVSKMTTTQESGFNTKIPEVGWRKIEHPSGSAVMESSLFENTVDRFFYFVHSYEAKPLNTEVVTGCYQRGEGKVVASVAHNNIFGVQYHPEKSGKYGLEFLQRFVSFKSP